jgi:hypothetical protein
MEEKEIKLIDSILKFMIENGFKMNTNYDGDSIIKDGFSNNDIRIELDILLKDLKLINWFENSDCVYRLTIEGKEAAKNGIEKYIESIEQEKKLDTDVKTASIKSLKLSKIAIIISIIAVIASFIVPFLA